MSERGAIASARLNGVFSTSRRGRRRRRRSIVPRIQGRGSRSWSRNWASYPTSTWVTWTSNSPLSTGVAQNQNQSVFCWSTLGHMAEMTLVLHPGSRVPCKAGPEEITDWSPRTEESDPDSRLSFPSTVLGPLCFAPTHPLDLPRSQDRPPRICPPKDHASWTHATSSPKI